MTRVLLITGARSLADDPAAEACRYSGWSVCRWCNGEVDRDTCQCGDSLAAHDAWSGHGFYPTGCLCCLRIALCDPRDRGRCAVQRAEVVS